MSKSMQLEKETRKPVHYEKILQVVSKWYGVDRICLIGICNNFKWAKEQRICMYLLRKLGNLKYTKIAEIMGRKDHMTVIHGINKIIVAMREDQMLRNEVLGITEKLKL